LRIMRLGAGSAAYAVYSRETEGDEMVLWSRAALRIGWAESPTETTVETGPGAPRTKRRSSPGRDRKLFTDLLNGDVKEFDPEIGKHQNLLARLGVAGRAYLPHFWVTPESKESVRKFLAERGIGRNELRNELIVIAPGAQYTYREWGEKNYADIIR